MKDISIKPILRIIAFHSWLYILAQEGPTHETGSKTPGAPASPNLPRLHHPPKRDRWSPGGEVSGQRGPGGEWWRWSQVAKAVQVVNGMVFKSQREWNGVQEVCFCGKKNMPKDPQNAWPISPASWPLHEWTATFLEAYPCLSGCDHVATA